MGGQRLSREDWIAAGLAALLEAGPRGVTIEGIAARLGATKGSGYWHFSSRAELLALVVERWRHAHTGRLIRVATGQATPQGALQALFEVIFERRSTTNEARVLLSDEPTLAPIIREIAEERIGFVAGLARECGIAPEVARRRAETAYCTVVGHELLLAASPDSLDRTHEAGRERARSVVAALLA